MTTLDQMAKNKPSMNLIFVVVVAVQNSTAETWDRSYCPIFTGRIIKCNVNSRNFCNRCVMLGMYSHMPIAMVYVIQGAMYVSGFKRVIKKAALSSQNSENDWMRHCRPILWIWDMAILLQNVRYGCWTINNSVYKSKCLQSNIIMICKKLYIVLDLSHITHRSSCNEV